MAFLTAVAYSITYRAETADRAAFHSAESLRLKRGRCGNSDP